MSAAIGDPLASLDTTEVATLRAVADRLIPAAGDMPSAADVLSDARLRFVLNARPDLLGPLRAALRPELGDDVAARLETLGRHEPATLYPLQLVIVGGYYTATYVAPLVVWAVAGLWWYLARAVRRRQGVDLDAIHSEIPAE